MDQTNQRFVALDLHATYIMVGALDAHQRVVLQPRRVKLDHFAAWAMRHLQPTDQVVLEATTNAWYIHDLVQPLGARVVVADPAKAKAKMALSVKTDRRDTLALAMLLVANMVPEVWVPPVPVRELRSLLAHRQRLVRQRTAAKNRLRGLLHRHHIVPPAGNLFAASQRVWWTGLDVSSIEHLRIQQNPQRKASGWGKEARTPPFPPNPLFPLSPSPRFEPAAWIQMRAPYAQKRQDGDPKLALTKYLIGTGST